MQYICSSQVTSAYLLLVHQFLKQVIKSDQQQTQSIWPSCRRITVARYFSSSIKVVCTTLGYTAQQIYDLLGSAFFPLKMPFLLLAALLLLLDIFCIGFSIKEKSDHFNRYLHIIQPGDKKENCHHQMHRRRTHFLNRQCALYCIKQPLFRKRVSIKKGGKDKKKCDE